MKKLSLALFLTLVTLGFLISPALAAADAPRAAPSLSVADRAFIASLAAPNPSPAPVLAAQRPPTGGVGEKSLCTAEANCALGGTVRCEGNSSCSAADGNCEWGFLGYVRCDGVYTWCGGSCCPENFCTGADACASSCYPCDADYTCHWGSCSDNCDCRWSTCPI